MSTTPHQIPFINLYQQPSDRIEELLQPQLKQYPMLWIKVKHPPKNTKSTWLPLTHGPSSYIGLFGAFTIPQASSMWGQQLEKHFQICYQEIIECALQQQSFEPSLLLKHLALHLELDKQWIYPWVQQCPVALSRIYRERTYEADGIKKIWSDYPSFLQRVQAGETSKKERDDFQTFALHLVEHHIQYKSWGLYPATELFFPANWESFIQAHGFLG